MTPAEFKRARKMLGMSQKQFAAALGLADSGTRTVQRIEAGATITGPMALAVKHLLSQRGTPL